MAKDQDETLEGGYLRDKYGRRELVLAEKHVAPGTTALPQGDGYTDADGREQVVLLGADGRSISSRVDSVETGVPFFGRKTIYQDTFDRSDRAGLAGNPDGADLTVTGAGAAAARIVSNAYGAGAGGVGAGFIYAYTTLPERPTTLYGSFTFATGAGGTANGLNMMWANDTLLAEMVHMSISPNGGRLSWWHSGSVDQVMATGITDYAFATPLAVDGTTEHWVEMSIVNETVILTFSNGETFVASDPIVPTIAQLVAFWEIRAAAAPLYDPRWTRVVAYGDAV